MTQKIKRLLGITLIFAVLFSFSMIIFAQTVPNSSGFSTVAVEDEFDLHFEDQWIRGDENEQTKILPDVDSIVDNISTFIEPGYSVYTGDQIPQENSFYKYHYELKLTHIHIYDDKDMFDSGEIYIQGFVNWEIDDDMPLTEQFDIYIGAFNDDEGADVDITLYDAWAYDLKIALELYDEDPAQPDDIYGTWETFLDWENETTFVMNYSGDALATYELTIKDGPYLADAGDLLDAYKPYLYSDVETIYDDPADSVFGRVIEGYDEIKGYNTTCLQFLYYFPYEYTGNNDFVHHWDWEMILIFIDYSQGSRYPYRLVWDNGHYFEGPSGYDWIDGQKYTIFDDAFVPGDYNYDIEFSQVLKPLLGTERTIKMTLTSMSDVYDSGKENWGWFEWGMPTFQATVETSYHQFDLGDPIGTDPMDMNRDYTVHEFDNTIIRSAYKSLNKSFNEGIHSLDGYYTPNYAPFSWDISQPFKFPYLFNNYEKLATDINAFNDAKVSKTFDYSVQKDIKVSLDIPCTISADIPRVASPNDEISSDVTFVLDETQSFVYFDIWYLFDFSVDLLYSERAWAVEINETVIYNIGTGEITFLGHTLDTNGDNQEFSFDDIQLGDYISIDGEINSPVVGTFLDMKFAISISELIKTFIGPAYSWIVDEIVDNFDFIINPKLEGFIEFDLTLGNELIEESIRITQLNTTLPITITMPEGSTEYLYFGIENLGYGVTFEVDWRLSLCWATIPAIFIEDQSWYLGTWPSQEIFLSAGVAETTSLGKFEYSGIESRWVLVEGIGGFSQTIDEGLNNANNDSEDDNGAATRGGGGIAGFPLYYLILVASLVTVFKFRKSQKE